MDARGSVRAGDTEARAFEAPAGRVGVVGRWAARQTSQSLVGGTVEQGIASQARGAEGRIRTGFACRGTAVAPAGGLVLARRTVGTAVSVDQLVAMIAFSALRVGEAFFTPSTTGDALPAAISTYPGAFRAV